MNQTNKTTATKRALTTAAMAALWLATAAGGAAADTPAAKQPPADFHVAVSGNDGNPGTATSPFATIQRACAAVRGKIKDGLTNDLVVEIGGVGAMGLVLRGGTANIAVEGNTSSKPAPAA